MCGTGDVVFRLPTPAAQGLVPSVWFGGCWRDLKDSCTEPRRAGGHVLCGKAEKDGLV